MGFKEISSWSMWFLFWVLYYFHRLNCRKYSLEKKSDFKIKTNKKMQPNVFSQSRIYLEILYDWIPLHNFFSFKLFIYLKYFILSKDSGIEVLEFIVLKEEYEPFEKCSSATCFSKWLNFIVKNGASLPIQSPNTCGTSSILYVFPRK